MKIEIIEIILNNSMFVSIKLYVNFFLLQLSTLNWNISKLKNSYFTNTRENFFKLKKKCISRTDKIL